MKLKSYFCKIREDGWHVLGFSFHRSVHGEIKKADRIKYSFVVDGWFFRYQLDFLTNKITDQFGRGKDYEERMKWLEDKVIPIFYKREV